MDPRDTFSSTLVQEDSTRQMLWFLAEKNRVIGRVVILLTESKEMPIVKVQIRNGTSLSSTKPRHQSLL
jgi:hypothetical protein